MPSDRVIMQSFFDMIFIPSPLTLKLARESSHLDIIIGMLDSRRCNSVLRIKFWAMNSIINKITITSDARYQQSISEADKISLYKHNLIQIQVQFRLKQK
jgi:hypothetical protein